MFYKESVGFPKRSKAARQIGAGGAYGCGKFASMSARGTQQQSQIDSLALCLEVDSRQHCFSFSRRKPPEQMGALRWSNSRCFFTCRRRDSGLRPEWFSLLHVRLQIFTTVASRSIPYHVDAGRRVTYASFGFFYRVCLKNGRAVHGRRAIRAGRVVAAR